MGPGALMRVTGVHATWASTSLVMFPYVSLAAFLTVIRAGNEDSVVGPAGISVVFISATPPTIN